MKNIQVEDNTLVKPYSQKSLGFLGFRENSQKIRVLQMQDSCREERMLGEEITLAREINFRSPMVFYAMYRVLGIRVNCEKFTNIWKDRVLQQ